MSQEGLQIDLETFQGPFDLLLHLIKTMEVDINDIPILEVTEQYLNYIHSMQTLELDIIGDYLVMAATLIEIKSRWLLPIEPIEGLEDELEIEDPRSHLVQQLLMYQQFQEVSSILQSYEDEQSRVYTRPKMDTSQYETFVPLSTGEISIDDLVHAMKMSLDNYVQRLPKNKEIIQDSISVDEVIQEITSRITQLNNNESLYFNDLLRKKSRSYIITTFMAILELVRKQEIVFRQNQLFDPIEILKVK